MRWFLSGVVLVFILSVLFVYRTSITGHEVSVFGEDAEKAARQGAAMCARAPFAEDRAAKPCGSGCCFGSQTCYKDAVCCDSTTENGEDTFGIFYCKRKQCDASLGQTACGQTCCDTGNGEVCKEQGIGKKKYGSCLAPEQAKGCRADLGEQRCPAKGALKSCCAANQECTSRTVDVPALPALLDPVLWGCTVVLSKAGGCGADTLCRGTQQFAGYNVCCLALEQCVLHPSGQPYCFPRPLSPRADTEPSENEGEEHAELVFPEGAEQDSGIWKYFFG